MKGDVAIPAPTITTCPSAALPSGKAEVVLTMLLVPVCVIRMPSGAKAMQHFRQTYHAEYDATSSRHAQRSLRGPSRPLDP